jgi:hypothetical protein
MKPTFESNTILWFSCLTIWTVPIFFVSGYDTLFPTVTIPGRQKYLWGSIEFFSSVTNIQITNNCFKYKLQALVRHILYHAAKPLFTRKDQDNHYLKNTYWNPSWCISYNIVTCRPIIKRVLVRMIGFINSWVTHSLLITLRYSTHKVFTSHLKSPQGDRLSSSSLDL